VENLCEPWSINANERQLSFIGIEGGVRKQRGQDDLDH